MWKRYLVTCCLMAALAAVPTAASAQCQQDPDVLRADRMAAAKRWVERVNWPNDDPLQGRAHYLEVSNELLTEDGTFTVKQVGTFSPKILAVEYGLAIFPLVGWPSVKFVQLFDPYRTQWLGTDRLELYAKQRTSLQPNQYGEYAIVIDDLRHHEILDFEPCSIRIRLSFVINDDIIEKLFETPPNLNVTQICGGILLACPIGSPLQQYDSFQDCVDFMNAIPPSVCPFPFTSHTLLCRALHLEQAFINPVVHCPHVGKHSHTCFERCLPDCASCSPDGRCVAAYTDITTPGFQCQCNEGFSGTGEECALNTCSAPRQCPAKQSLATCTDGACGCAEDVRWDPSLTALHHKQACGCAEGELLTQREDGAPVCVPLGRCFDVKDCPQSPQVVQCLSTPGNPFDTSNICACNYGYGGGWESPCVCPPDRREVNMTQGEGKVCLAADECIHDSNCGGGMRCVVSSGELIGTCSPL